MRLKGLMDTRKFWHCVNCDAKAVTVDNKIPMHPCNSKGNFSGLMIPLTIEGESVKVTANEREDFVGSEVVQTNANGIPIMSVAVETEEGQGLTIFAPVATASGKSELHDLV